MGTTIAVTENIRDQLKEFGTKGESYNDIISKLIESAKERQLHDLLFDESDSVPAREALARAKKQWHK